jgi:hypothetical protein
MHCRQRVDLSTEWSDVNYVSADGYLAITSVAIVRSRHALPLRLDGQLK